MGAGAEALKDKYKNAIERNGYKFFESGMYNINIVGVRTTADEPNAFNDHLALIYKDSESKWVVDKYRITTDPGTYWLKHPSRVSGTAILVPGQYSGVYKIDLHKGLYEALCQRNGIVRVYRDSNLDEICDVDSGSIEEGWFGINIHRSTKNGSSNNIDKWSAGCQVFKNSIDFGDFMKLVKISSKYYGDTFTYTLLDEGDLG